MTRIGLALGAGCVRGVAHIGVLRVLERARASTCRHMRYQLRCDHRARLRGRHGLSTTWPMSPSRCSGGNLLRPSLRRDRLFDPERLERFLETLIGARDFADLEYVCGASACDRTTREHVLLVSGDPVRAARASSAMRRIFPPVEIDGRQLIDGAVIDAIPVDAARRLGADYVIGVSVWDQARRRRPPHARTASPEQQSSPDRLIRPLVSRLLAVGLHERSRADTSRRGSVRSCALPAIRVDLGRGRLEGAT